MKLALSLALAAASSQDRVVVDRDDFVIDRDCVVEIAPGPIEDAAGDGVIRIRKAGIVVDLSGAPLHGAPEGREADAFSGIGLVIEVAGVTLRNARVSGFKVGILARHADGLVLEGCDVSGNFRQRLLSTPEAEDGADWLWPHANDGKEWRTNYGGGMCVEDSRGIVVRDCRAREGQNGLILDRVEASKIYDNDFSFLSGWGIAMWRSSENVVSRNALDFCVRGYSHGIYNRGQDSAGLLMFEQCCRNVIAENSITHGGDGVFAFAGKEALGETPPLASREAPGEPLPPAAFDYKRKGCNDNSFLANDLSYAAAHGLELTFSFGNLVDGNRFVENAICGIWGGYSQGTGIQHNEFLANGLAGYGLERGGVNIEHSKGSHIYFNRFSANACGVHLWWDADEGLMKTPWAAANGGECDQNWIAFNSFTQDALGLQLRGCVGTHVGRNGFEGVERTIESDKELIEDIPSGGSMLIPTKEDLGETRPVGARSNLDGREKILMTEWGPYDWEGPYLQRVGNRGASHVWRWLGSEELLNVKASGDVEVDREEAGPDAQVLVVSSERRDAFVPYALVARSFSGVLRREGVLSTLRWSVRVFPWTRDPREDEAGWRRERKGGVAFEVADLDLSYGMGGASQLAMVEQAIGASNLPADRFGTLAETHVNLPKGRWELTVTSDDGVRVKVDRKTVLEDWTWHAPKTESVELEVERERSFHLEVEHFELDGFAVLKLVLAPVD